MLTTTDMFCGAGGSTLGATMNANVVAGVAINHWERAVASHNANFPDAVHDCADVTQVNPRRYPTTDILLASPECTNHSLAKGARRRKPQAASLWDDGPAGDAEQDKSRATMWDVPRFAEVHRYKAIIVENVTDAFRWGPDDNGAMFDHWLKTMHLLDYEHEIVWLNSMFADGSVPQSRDRMYVVFWRRGQRRPNLKVEPPSWCPSCEKVVPGQQAWKPHVHARPNGRYGAQYVYRCGSCASIVYPGAMPAASAIDWNITAARICDRERPLAAKTMARIERGLKRLATQDRDLTVERGLPKPMTLPLVGGSAAGAAGMMLPVAGNTFERTPGNRARDVARAPMPTIHGTAEQALITPPSAMGVRLSLSHADRDLATEQIPTLTRCHDMAMVVANYAPGWSRDAATSPAGSVTTRDGHSLVVPYYSTGECSNADLAAIPTLTTRDRVALAWDGVELEECRFRMFELHEIARVMGMHEHSNGQPYIVTGNKRERMAQYGNAVTPPAMKLLVDRVAASLNG